MESTILLKEKSFVQMQVIQRSLHEFVVRVVLDDQARRRGTSAFEAFASQRFESLLGPDPLRRIGYSYEERIERTAGGKIRNVIREFAAP